MSGVTAESDERLFAAVGFRWDRDACPVVRPPEPISVERAVCRYLAALP